MVCCKGDGDQTSGTLRHRLPNRGPSDLPESVLHPQAQDLADTPGLRNTAGRAVWRVAVKYFRYAPQPGLGQVIHQRLQQSAGVTAAASEGLR